MSNNKKSPLDFIDIITSFPTEGLTMEERAGLVNALKNKLKSMGGSDSDVLDNLKPAVRKRSELLTDLKSEHDAIEAKCQMLYAPLYKTEHDEIAAKFYEDRVGLEEKYQKLYASLYSKSELKSMGGTDFLIDQSKLKSMGGTMIDIQREEIEGKYLEERDELYEKYHTLYAQVYSKMSYTGSTEMLILWDFNNLPLVNIQFLRKAVLEKFPEIKLKIKAYANQISPAQLKVCESVAANVTFVSSQLGEADRVMMVDLFEYVYDHPAPNWVMVITTDSDFAWCLHSVSARRYGTILVCDTVRVSKDLKDSVQYYYDWNNLEEISEELRAPPAEVCAEIAISSLEMRLANGSNNTAVLWNIEALPAPSDMHQDDAIRVLMEQIIQPYIQELKPVPLPFHVYGNFSLPPILKQAKNVRYIIARDNPQDKHRSIENLMVHYILRYAWDNSAPSNIFIIDKNVNLKSPILSLTSRGFKVFLVGAPDVSGIKNKDTKQTSQDHLRAAASLCLDFPDFTGCYTPTPV